MHSMFIDAHTHIYPECVKQNPIEWAEAHQERHWKALIKPHKNGMSLQGFVDRETMLRHMDEAGIEHSLLLGWYWEHPDSCQQHNDWMKDWVDGHADRFSRAFAVHPKMSNLEDQLKKAYDEGVKGIGECFPYIQHQSLLHKDWEVIYHKAIQFNWPITFHVTEPVGRAHAGCVPHDLRDYLELAERYPDLKIVLAHWGGLLPFYELNPFVKNKFKNVYYDTAASTLLYDERIWALALQAVGAEKIIFGSDYPLKPALKASGPTVIPLIEQAKAVLDKNSLKSLLRDNAKRLWNIPL